MFCISGHLYVAGFLNASKKVRIKNSQENMVFLSSQGFYFNIIVFF